MADAISGDDNLLIEILQRLPSRSLVRFESVSKHWYSLITTIGPLLSRRVSPYHPTTASGLLLYELDEGYRGHFVNYVPLDKKPAALPAAITTHPPFLDNPSSHDYSLRSCNGLICCWDPVSHLANLEHLFVINPATNQSTGVPLPPRSRNELVYLAFSVAFLCPPSSKLSDLDSPYFQVVCVQQLFFDNPRQCRIHIYSSETGDWSGRTFRFQVRNPSTVMLERGVYCNGAIHWITNSNAAMDDPGLCFVLDQGSFCSMPLMPVNNEGRDVRYFGESRGHLHLILGNHPCPAEFNVYELERDYSSWFIKYWVKLDNVYDAFHELFMGGYVFDILCVVRKENEQESSLVLYLPCTGKIFQYSFKDGTMNKLIDVDADRQYLAYQYIEAISFV